MKRVSHETPLVDAFIEVRCNTPVCYEVGWSDVSTSRNPQTTAWEPACRRYTLPSDPIILNANVAAVILSAAFGMEILSLCQDPTRPAGVRKNPENIYGGVSPERHFFFPASMSAENMKEQKIFWYN